MNAIITELNENNFTDFTNKDGVTLVKISTSWCQPCKRYNPIINELSLEYNDINFGTLEADGCMDYVKDDINVRTVPTTIIYKDGVEVERFHNIKTKKEVVEILDKYK